MIIVMAELTTAQAWFAGMLIWWILGVTVVGKSVMNTVGKNYLQNLSTAKCLIWLLILVGPLGTVMELLITAFVVLLKKVLK